MEVGWNGGWAWFAFSLLKLEFDDVTIECNS